MNMSNKIETVLNEHQKLFLNNKFGIINTETFDKSKVNFLPSENKFTYNDKKGSYYFHGVNIVFLFVDNNRNLNVLQLKNEFFRILK